MFNSYDQLGQRDSNVAIVRGLYNIKLNSKHMILFLLDGGLVLLYFKTNELY